MEEIGTWSSLLGIWGRPERVEKNTKKIKKQKKQKKPKGDKVRHFLGKTLPQKIEILYPRIPTSKNQLN
jgi:hypothetical protein